jgi:hypothetical protein
LLSTNYKCKTLLFFYATQTCCSNAKEDLGFFDVKF